MLPTEVASPRVKQSKEEGFMTLKEIENQLKQERKSGYALIHISDNIADRIIQIGYFKDIADYHGISYEQTEVQLIKYLGWRI